MEYIYHNPETDQIMTIYKNDLKFKNLNNLDPKNIQNNNQKITDFESLEYRLSEITQDNPALDLSNLLLNNIPPGIPNKIPDYIQFLFLYNNNLETININLEKFQYLTILDICSNKLAILPVMPPNIRELICRVNILDNINILKNCKNLKRLDISYNLITNIPVLDSLEILICNNNNLTNIPILPNLIKLFCKNNNIKLLTCPNKLEILEIDNNNLESLTNLLNLRELYCCNNKLTKLDQFNRIEIIHTHNNNLNILLPYYNYLRELICDGKNIGLSKLYKLEDAVSHKNNIIELKFK